MERGAQSPSDKPEGQMDDILASIRRILQSDGSEQAAAMPEPPHTPVEHDSADHDVFDLHPSMRVPAPQDLPEPGLGAYEPGSFTPHDAPLHQSPPAAPAEDAEALLGASAAAQSGASLAALREALAAADTPKPASASPPIYRNGGLTIEDVVRDEVRTLLRGWLDDNLPPMVERLVRAEIARIAGQG